MKNDSEYMFDTFLISENISKSIASILKKTYNCFRTGIDNIILSVCAIKNG